MSGYYGGHACAYFKAARPLSLVAVCAFVRLLACGVGKAINYGEIRASNIASNIDIDDLSLASTATLEDALLSCSSESAMGQCLSWFKVHSLSLYTRFQLNAGAQFALRNLFR